MVHTPLHSVADLRYRPIQMPTTVAMPLIGPPPTEVPLATAPLVRVIAQVRFPLIASVGAREFIAPFQESIRQEYPVLRSEQGHAVVIGAQGARDTRLSPIWRFNDTTSSWRVSLAPDFLALETTRYSSRADFFGRFNRLLTALEEHVDPRVIDRLGVRYIDRVVGDLANLQNLVRPEVAGIMATPLGSHARQSIVENVFTLPDEAGQLMARWGLVPARATVDLAALEAIEEPSWLLDLDAFHRETRAFEVDAVLSQARSFAERIYSFFRWAVTDDFLRRYGGEP